MDKLVKTGKFDPRDKRFVSRRRRMRLPWFAMACFVVLAGLGWLSIRLATSRASNIASIPHLGATVSGGDATARTNDW
jgi:hypothetical protein